MVLLPFFFLFIIGLAVGSFLNVVIYRTVHGDSAFRGRSYCDHCKKPIAWYDNIPLISFLLLQHKCRYCGNPIPWEYPALEFLTGALFVWWYFIGSTFFQLTIRPLVFIQPLFWLMVGIILLVIFFSDLSYYLIPNSAVFLLTLLSIAYRIFLVSRGAMMPHDFVVSLVAATIASLFFLLLVVITRGRSMGMGDVKLVFPLGIIVGFPAIIGAIYISFILGAVIGVALIVSKKRTLKSAVPFGPFLILGSFIALVWAPVITSFYQQFL